jgi:hypothetical protein
MAFMLVVFGSWLFARGWRLVAGGSPLTRIPAVVALFRLNGAVPRDPAVEAWLEGRAGELGGLAREWFGRIRECGADVREVMHDGCPTACVGDAAFAYVNVFTAHCNVGFFQGASLADPAGLLEGTGKFMRHVKLRPGRKVDAAALRGLIVAAYREMAARVAAGEQ